MSTPVQQGAADVASSTIHQQQFERVQILYHQLDAGRKDQVVAALRAKQEELARRAVPPRQAQLDAFTFQLSLVPVLLSQQQREHHASKSLVVGPVSLCQQWHTGTHNVAPGAATPPFWHQHQQQQQLLHTHIGEHSTTRTNVAASAAQQMLEWQRNVAAHAISHVQGSGLAVARAVLPVPYTQWAARAQARALVSLGRSAGAVAHGAMVVSAAQFFSRVAERARLAGTLWTVDWHQQHDPQPELVMQGVNGADVFCASLRSLSLVGVESKHSAQACREISASRSRSRSQLGHRGGRKRPAAGGRSSSTSSRSSTSWSCSRSRQTKRSVRASTHTMRSQRGKGNNDCRSRDSSREGYDCVGLDRMVQGTKDHHGAPGRTSRSHKTSSTARQRWMAVPVDVVDEQWRRTRRKSRFESASGAGVVRKPAQNDGAVQRPLVAKLDVQADFGACLEDLDELSAPFQIVGTSESLEKRFFRLTSQPDSACVRPLRVLKAALVRLRNLDDDPKQNPTYFYLSDQLKAIRQDLKVQNIVDEFVVETYAFNARLALRNDDLGQFNQCATQVHLLCHTAVPVCHDLRVEFCAYRLLYLAHQRLHVSLHGDMVELYSCTELRSSPAVCFALAVRQSIAHRDYFRYFRLAHGTAPLLCNLLVHSFQPRMRVWALGLLCRGYQKLSLDVLRRALLFADEAALVHYLQQEGVHMDSSPSLTDLGGHAATIDCRVSLKVFAQHPLLGNRQSNLG